MAWEPSAADLQILQDPEQAQPQPQGETVEDFDLVTIGAGSAGTRASRVAAQAYGAKVACVELPFGPVASEETGGAGGTCVIRGCVPKKLLVYASEFAEAFQSCKGFSWAVPGSPSCDWPQLLERKGKEIRRLNSVYNKLLADTGVSLIEGRAKLLDSRTVEVKLTAGGTRKLRAKHILLACGSRPHKIAFPGDEHAITSDDALVLEQLPGQTVAIVGAGRVAMEFATIFRGLGADVHVICRRKAPLPRFDGDCTTQVAHNLGKRGVTLHTECGDVQGLEKTSTGKLVLTYKGRAESECKLPADIVMLATGRSANTSNLGLQEAGVPTDQAGAVQVDEYSRTSVPGIWAVGDVTGRLAQTPVAIAEAMAFARSCLGGQLTSPDYTNVPSACFTQPPVACVGVTEEAAKEQCQGEVDVYMSRFKPMRNVLSGRDEKNLIKLLVEVASDKVIGVHMVGPDAPEIMQGVAIALKAGATKAHFSSTVGLHPTAAEELVTMHHPMRRIQCGPCAS